METSRMDAQPAKMRAQSAMGAEKEHRFFISFKLLAFILTTFVVFSSK
jgi:hypothetical protein